MVAYLSAIDEVARGYMKKAVGKDDLTPPGREAAAEYLYDMIAQMARLARRLGDAHAAIHLEAIIAAQHAIAKDR